MANTHLASIHAAERTTRELKRMFDRLGGAEHPRGRILSVYRAARRALRGNFDNPRAVSDALMTLRLSVQRIAQEDLGQAAALGQEQAERELDALGIPAQTGIVSTTEAERAITTQVDSQIAQVEAIALTGGDESLVIGDDARVGSLSPAPVTNEITRWLTFTAILAIATMQQQSIQAVGAQNDFVKQAIAAIDERTTDTCLRVHGQTQRINDPFKLTGTPRFADEMDRPPFHWYCRTATALVSVESADDDLTQRMRMLAKEERDFRADIDAQIAERQQEIANLGGNPTRSATSDTEEIRDLRREIQGLQNAKAAEIHPSNAFSRRGR